jgi:hypothetical protein
MFQKNLFSKYALLCLSFCGLFFAANTAFAQGKREPLRISAEKFIAIKSVKDIARLLELPDTVEIQRFEITYYKKDTDPTTASNETAELDPATLKMVTWAVVGDTYYFDNLYIKTGEIVNRVARVCRIVE